jgi:hypothetical protein
MQPIVNGLQGEFGEQIDVVSLNAADGAEGQAAFVFYGLRGHPTVMLVEPGGAIAWTRTGLVTQEELEQELQEVLKP